MDRQAEKPERELKLFSCTYKTFWNGKIAELANKNLAQTVNGQARFELLSAWPVQKSKGALGWVTVQELRV